MARYFTCGWESGRSTGTTPGANEFLPMGNTGGAAGTVAVAANPAWWTSLGSYVMKNTGPAYCQHNGNTIVWFGFKWGVDTLPSIESSIMQSGSGTFKVTVDTNGALRLYTGSTLRATSANGVIAAATCYFIDIKCASGSYEVWVNDTQILTSATGTDTMFNIMLGEPTAVAGYVQYYDDYYGNDANASASNQTGRRGSASVKCVLPNADNGSSPTGFTNSAGLTFGNATTGWFSAIDDARPYNGGITDYVGKSTANANYYEAGFVDSAAGEAPQIVYACIWHHATSAAAGQVSALIRANGADQTAVSFAPAVTTALCGIVHADVAAAGVAWTKTLFDAASMKWGASTDVTPNPRLDVAYMCYETPEVVPYVRPKISAVTRQAGQRAAVR